MKKKIFISVLVFVLIISFLLSLNCQLQRLSGQSLSYFTDLLKNSDQRSIPQNILVLGLDPRDDWLEKNQITDTIIVVNISKDKSRLNMFSLPRDLWYYPDSQKINQIYEKSLKNSDPSSYLKDRFTQITGQNIDKVIVFTTANIVDFIDLLGGVDLYLEKGFTDTQYPNPDYIKYPDGNFPIYKTVSFPDGWIKITANNVVEFVRSRKSADTSELGGTDLGRIRRQQQLIEAIISNLKTQSKSVEFLFSLYRFWHSQIKTDMTDQDLINLCFALFPHRHQLALNKIEIPTGEDPQNDIIYHPSKFINPQWVFITKDQDYQVLKDFINKSLLY